MPSLPPEQPIQQPPQYYQSSPKLNSLLSSKKVLIGGLALLVLLILGGGIALLGVSSAPKKNIAPPPAVYIPPTITPTPLIYPTSYPSSEDTKSSEWQTYVLPSLGLTFKLPAKVSNLGDLEEEKVPGQTGTQLCGIFVKKTGFLPKAYAGGGCSTNNNPYLELGTTSTNYSAGREGMFTDLQGFTFKQEKYFLKFVGKVESDEAFAQERISTISNPSGVQIIKIKGTTIVDDGPTLSNSLGNNTGALINTKNKTYPGLAIIFKNGLSEKEIDQILLSFAFTK